MLSPEQVIPCRRILGGSVNIEEQRNESGQTMAEYAVVLGVITVAVVGALTVLSGTISSVIASVTASL